MVSKVSLLLDGLVDLLRLCELLQDSSVPGDFEAGTLVRSLFCVVKKSVLATLVGGWLLPFTKDDPADNGVGTGYSLVQGGSQIGPDFLKPFKNCPFNKGLS